MPRVSRARTRQNRVAIEREAVRLFRTEGFQVSIADVMAAAGLTAGGFYGHFASKDALIVRACDIAFAESARHWRARARAAGTGATPLRTIAARYLTSAHRDAPSSLCPLATLPIDVDRLSAGSGLATRFATGVDSLLAALASAEAPPAPRASTSEGEVEGAGPGDREGTGPGDGEGAGPGDGESERAGSGDVGRDGESAIARRGETLADLATMVGALVLARASRGSPLSDEILDAARRRLGVEPAASLSARPTGTEETVMTEASPAREPLWLDDLKVGDRFSSREIAIEEAAIFDFARQFDPQPFHLDPAAAEQSIFRGLAASGWHTAALTMRLLVESIPIGNGIVGMGVEVAWPTPTRPGDRLHTESTISAVERSRSKGDRGIATISTETLNQDGKIVQHVKARVLVMAKPDASATAGG